MASIEEKLLPALALILPTGVSIFLVSVRNRLWDGDFHDFVQSSRSAVQVIVQILSLVLAMLQIYALRKLFTLGTRLLLGGRRLSLDTLSLWAAISQAKLDSSLSKRYVVIIIAFVALTALPSALWAGALTPILSTDRQTGTIDIPAFTSKSQSVWASQFQIRPSGQDIQVWNVLDNCTEIHDIRGFVPTCPVPALQGFFLTSASSATSKTAGEPRLHSKLDNVRWSYSGRSFGVGASAGIAVTASIKGSNAFIAYQYQEVGYRAHVQCTKNMSSNIAVELYESTPLGYTWYVLTGSLANEPNGTGELYPVSSWDNPPKILVWAARSYEGNNMATIATSADEYTIFNQTQCSFTFIPAVFNVFINVTSRLIRVEERSTATLDRIENFEPTGNLTFSVVQSINLLSRMSNSLYVSVIGNALQTNVYNMESQLNTDSSENNSVLLAAVVDSFTAIIDDILVAYGASQLLNSGDSTKISVSGQKDAVRIGKHVWIYMALGLNLLLVFVYVEELIRTRLWKGLSRFDYTNIKCTIAAASAGGIGIASQIARSPDKWNGSSSDSVFTRVDIIFDEGSAAANTSNNIGLPALRVLNKSTELASPFVGSPLRERDSPAQQLSPLSYFTIPVLLGNHSSSASTGPVFGNATATKYTPLTHDGGR